MSEVATLVAQANARGPTSGFTDVSDDAVQLPPDFNRAAARILTPLKVGSFTLQHRIVHAALGRSRSVESEESPLAEEYFSQRATPDGLIISQATGVKAKWAAWSFSAGLYNDNQIKAVSRNINAVHAKGGIWFQQLTHVGRCTSPALVKQSREKQGLFYPPHYGYRSVSSSEVEESGINTHSGEPFGKPHALTIDEIHEIVNDFRQTAKFAVQAGADGIEILSGNGFLLDQFLHDNINQRTDQYGGSVENRSRFPLEVIDAVAEVVGYQNIGVRISPFSNFHETDGSQPLEQLLYLGRQLALRGVAYLHVGEPRVSRNLDVEANLQRLLAKGIPIEDVSLRPFRKLVREVHPSNPLFTPTVLFGAGGYTSASGVLTVEEDLADAVVYGRRFISNPDLVHRIRFGYPLTPYDRSTFYTHGAQGYVTYTTYEEQNAKLGSIPKGKETPSLTLIGASPDMTTNGTSNGIVAKAVNENGIKPLRKVAIIGAGVSGIVSASALKRLGAFDIHIFERKGVPGGSWVYDPISTITPVFPAAESNDINPPLGRPHGKLPVTVTRSKQQRFLSSPLYEDIRANIPADVMTEGSTFKLPIPRPETDPYLTAFEIASGVAQTAHQFDEYIRYNTCLEDVDKIAEDRLNLVLRHENPDGTDTWYEEEFDHLIIATGHNSVPRVPDIPGLDVWTGQLRHTTTYRSGEEFKGKRILIVGTSESAIDVCLQSLPHVRQPIYVSQRSLHPRFPTVFNRKGVQVVPTISHFGPTVIHLTDGTTITDVDTVVFATGYFYTYPFLSPTIRPPPASGSRVPGLYQHIFDTHNLQTIAFIGVANATLSWLAWEKSAFLVGLYWSGQIRLPPLEKQREWEARRLAQTDDRHFHILATQPERVLYFDTLNELAGDYLRTRAMDDALLRDYPFEWVLSLIKAREVKLKFYGIEEAKSVV